MKKLLPKTIKNPQGFTLVELMIVITIIAILAVIGLTIFTGTQARARNGKRRQEVSSISKALEVNRPSSSNVYPGQINPAWFVGNTIPQDPRAAGAKYCFYHNDDVGEQIVTMPSGVTWNPATTDCASIADAAWPSNNADGAEALNTPTALDPAVPVTAYSFLICTLLEPETIGGTGVPFCLLSQQ